MVSLRDGSRCSLEQNSCCGRRRRRRRLWRTTAAASWTDDERDPPSFSTADEFTWPNWWAPSAEAHAALTKKSTLAVVFVRLNKAAVRQRRISQPTCPACVCQNKVLAYTARDSASSASASASASGLRQPVVLAERDANALALYRRRRNGQRRRRRSRRITTISDQPLADRLCRGDAEMSHYNDSSSATLSIASARTCCAHCASNNHSQEQSFGRPKPSPERASPRATCSVVGRIIASLAYFTGPVRSATCCCCFSC